MIRNADDLANLRRALTPPAPKTSCEPLPKGPKPTPRPLGKRGPKPAELVASEAVVRARSGGRCEAGTPDCEGGATQVHHRAGRNGTVRNDAGEAVSAHHPSVLLDVCGLLTLTGCHGYLHRHVSESYANGWMLKRNTQVSP